MISLATKKNLALGIAAITAVWLLNGLVQVIRWRIYIRKLRAQGLVCNSIKRPDATLTKKQPMPPHNIIFGHFLIVVRLVTQLPRDAHPCLLPEEIRRAYPELGPNFYVDLSPFSISMLVVGSPETNYQIAVEHPLEKTMTLKNFVRPLTDGLDFLTMEYARWKKWRAIFNPGFSAAHLMTLVPSIVEAAETFTEILEEKAKHDEIFPLKRLTDYMTLDVIGQVVLGTQFDCQRKKNRMCESLRTQINWFTHGQETNLLNRWNIARPFVHWYNARIVNAYISEEFDKRVKDVNEDSAARSPTKRTRNIVDLVIGASQEIQTDGQKDGDQITIDPFFKTMCIAQIKLFLFGGHDTTSSALCYHLYLLSKHPKILERVQKEHSTVFGPDVKQAAAAMKASPQLLNQIPLTTAVIKESLRLFPPVPPSRQGEQGFSVKDGQGRTYPTGDFLVFVCTQMIHHDPAYWPDAMSFIPDRYLVEPDDPLYPVKGAWRGFEHGPRNCIGQELAMLEMKVALVMTARQFVFKPAYDEIDAKLGKPSPTVHGEKAYQVDSLQPRGDLPVRVEVVNDRT